MYTLVYPCTPVCLYISYVHVHSYLVITVFLEHPSSVDAASGTTVQFSCKAKDAEGLSFRVDGYSASLEDIHDRGFHQLHTVSLGNKILRRNLTVPSVDKNAEISCLALGSKEVDSKIAYLTVQGL